MIRKNIIAMWIIGILVLIAIVGTVLFYFQKTVGLNLKKDINSFEECVSAGHSILESYPRQCVTSGGKKFIENIGNLIEKMDLIKVNNLLPNQTISSPITIEGAARGFWFFEGSFPISVLDERENIISQSIATSQGNWMTKNFVPFKATVEFGVDFPQNGTIIFKKNNPSGLAQNDDQLIIPVKLSN